MAVYLPDAKTQTLMPIIREQFKYYRINHCKLFAHKRNHINGIENFWNHATRRMRKFNGVPKEQFHLVLKECE